MGNAIDGIWALVIIVAGLTMALIGMYVLFELNAQVAASFPGVPAAADAAQAGMDWIALLDAGVVALFFGYVIVILLLAYLVPSHPVFAVLFFFIVLIQIPVADGLKHYVNEVINTPELSPFAPSFANTLLILDWSPILLLVIGILTVIIQIARGGSSSHTGGVYG